MSSTPTTPGVTVTETINEDGSKTVTTVTIHEDGSKSTKRKTIRPKKAANGASPKTPPAAVAKPRNGGGTSMEDALEDALELEGLGHKDNVQFEQAVRRCIPSEFLLIASQDDLTQAQEAYHASTFFNLPNPKGQAGSLGTSALLQFLYERVHGKRAAAQPVNCLEVLREMRSRMLQANPKFDLHPMISSSRPLGPPRMASQYAPFCIVPPTHGAGIRRALLIGIQFIDDEKSKRLKAPINDVHNVKHYLTQKCGFDEANIAVLQDELPRQQQDPKTAPTKANIWAGFKTLIDSSRPGDVVFIQYSGHGGRVKDASGDGYDCYILPSDYKTEGQILDDDILRDLIKAMPAGVYTTMLVDCCNSGTVGDLPYVLKPTTTRDQEIEKFFDTDTREEILEKEAQGIREKEAYKKAKAERKKQRELEKLQREADRAATQVKLETDAAELAQKLVGMNTDEASPWAMTTVEPTMQTFHVKSEEEVAALTKKYGVAFQLSREQKDCLHQGGTVTLSFQTQPQQPQMMTMAPQQQTGMIMMTPEQAEAFKKANGGKLVMTPEQAAMFMKRQQQ